jgi:hypothetical protein
MNQIEQEIWKRCYSSFKLSGRTHKDNYLTIDFDGEFQCNSPVYHFEFHGYRYTIVRDIRGWVVRGDDVWESIIFDSNDPRFPKLPDEIKMWKGTQDVFDSYITRLREGLEKLKPSEPPPPKTLSLLEQNIQVPREIIYLICGNLLICELEWLERKLCFL